VIRSSGRRLSAGSVLGHSRPRCGAGVLSLEEIAQSQPPHVAATIRQAAHAAVDAYVFSRRRLNHPRGPPTVVSEDHLWREWAHHQCPAPGMLVSERDTLHEIASLMSDSDREAFRRRQFHWALVPSSA
jgi:hypothetical protein